MQTINVALIGQGFMGRTHSNAWGQVAKFFKPPLKAAMHTVFGQPEENPQVFADNWGWKNAATDWQAVIRSPEIGLIDVVTPNYMHAPVAQAAIAAGKPVACEKPIAGTLAEAREMAQKARAAGVKTFAWFNYRRVPAVARRTSWSAAGRWARSATSVRRTSRTGPTTRCRCCGASTRSCPAPAPTATSTPTSSI